MNRLLIYGTAAALSAGVAAIAVPRPSPPVMAETVVVRTLKADQEVRPADPPEPAEDFVKTVRTVTVAPLWRPTAQAPKFEPTPEPVIAQTEFPSLPKPPKIAGKNPQKSSGDVCARHGMKREEYDGGKRWRCRK